LSINERRDDLPLLEKRKRERERERERKRERKRELEEISNVVSGRASLENET